MELTWSCDEELLAAGYDRCPRCNAPLETGYDSEGIGRRERCTEGCYEYDFDEECVV